MAKETEKIDTELWNRSLALIDRLTAQNQLLVDALVGKHSPRVAANAGLYGSPVPTSEAIGGVPPAPTDQQIEQDVGNMAGI